MTTTLTPAAARRAPESSARPTQTPRRDWLAPALLIALGLVPAIAGISRLT